MRNLYDCSLDELAALLAEWKQPAFRARQLYRQLYVNLADDPLAMTDLPAALRERLAAETSIGALKPVREQVADNGLTRKVLWTLPGDVVIESVLMIYPPDRATVCVSTQAGCAMGCVFCATGRLGLLRNVSSGEILEQVMHFERTLRRESGELASRRGEPVPNHVTNLVFMGMGEPFANYERWWEAVGRLNDKQGFNLGARNMTVSTVGLVRGIRKLAEEPLQVNLAVSLHAPNDALRSELMPVNDRFPLAELMDAVRFYTGRTHRRVSFEYVLLEDKNDTPELAAELAELVKGTLCHVNLIPWNPVPGAPLERSHRQRVTAFQRVVQAAGISCTVRVERGVEIAAACGQLAALPPPPAGAISLTPA
ncbi:MAG TPA: 23S rRNA (adenine(2503)-C(2))-methyltransferase RlmN [Herpetosiphonaceae bacterium]